MRVKEKAKAKKARKVKARASMAKASGAKVKAKVLRQARVVRKVKVKVSGVDNILVLPDISATHRTAHRVLAVVARLSPRSFALSG